MKKIIVFVGMFLCATLMFASDLRTALKETAEQFSSSLRPKSVVAIIGIYSENSDFSDFMLDELTAQFIKIRKLTIADRMNLEAIKKEMSFQLSGEVGDESIQQLGAKIGAETVIQGVLKQFGGMYTLTIRALNVTTAAITDMYRATVNLNGMEIGMLGGKGKKYKGSKSGAVKVGFQNLLFGLGSYRNGHYGDGAFLTVTHLTAWILMISGAAILSNVEDPYYREDSYKNKELGSDGKWLEPRRTSAYKQDKDRYRSQVSTGIALISLFPFVALTAIIYGSVVPYYYEGPSLIAYGNNSGFKFDLALTQKGNITPQVSYVLRY